MLTRENQMPLLVRPATEADLPTLARMNRYLIEDEGSRNPMSVQGLQQRMSEWLRGDWKVELFVDDMDAIMGYAVYQFRRDMYELNKVVVYLRQLYIERDKRSRGLGSRAVELLARTRFPTGCRIEVDALASNPRGVQFWTRVGFQPYCTTMWLQNQETI
jgi:GNAT superfamily N-acetyltransferase